MDKSGSDYHDPQWMNYNEIELVSDNNYRFSIKVDETKKDFTESRYLNQETSDDVVDTDKILNFHDANRIRVYFKGKYLYEFDMTYDQFNAFREILNPLIETTIPLTIKIRLIGNIMKSVFG